MKKIVIILMIILMIIVGGISAFFCFRGKEIRTDAIKFKEEYESLNEKEYRSVVIDKDNPFVYTTPEEIVKKIENKETFYVYFGSKRCPWCRSVIEKAIQVAKEKGIKTIYYIDIWDEEGNEIVRDKYVLEDGIPKMAIKGTEAYYLLLKYFENILSDYILTDANNNPIPTNEKRIYAPNFIYVENGKALKLTEGTSSKQIDSKEKLTDEILKDEENLFQDFLNN